MATAPYNYSYIFKYIIIGKWATILVIIEGRVDAHQHECVGAFKCIDVVHLLRKDRLNQFYKFIYYMLPHTLKESSTFQGAYYIVFLDVVENQILNDFCA